MIEWRVKPLSIHGHQILDINGNEIVRDVYRKEDADQIVGEHNAVVFAVVAVVIGVWKTGRTGARSTRNDPQPPAPARAVGEGG